MEGGGRADEAAAHTRPPTTRHSTGVIIETMVERFGGDDSHVLSLGGEMSTDLLWMTGRMKRAQADGAVEQLKKTKAWRRLTDKPAELEKHKPESLDIFFRRVLTKLEDKTVILQFGINYYAAMIEAAEHYGLDLRFAPGSMFNSGGGLKGNIVTEEQRQKVFSTVPGPINDLYGFSEILNGSARKCSAGMYHPPHWVIRFVLDPDTGIPYPREGVRTGRYAAFDLWTQTYWGGFISGDEVTIDWDGGCACGRRGSYLHGEVARYTDLRGGDDKITCQRTAAAIQEVVDYMNAESL